MQLFYLEANHQRKCIILFFNLLMTTYQITKIYIYQFLA